MAGVGSHLPPWRGGGLQRYVPPAQPAWAAGCVHGRVPEKALLSMKWERASGSRSVRPGRLSGRLSNRKKQTGQVRYRSRYSTRLPGAWNALRATEELNFKCIKFKGNSLVGIHGPSVPYPSVSGSLSARREAWGTVGIKSYVVPAVTGLRGLVLRAQAGRCLLFCSWQPQNGVCISVRWRYIYE